ncbi:hypothetical protein C8R42DRAFT_648972 [Lentinula raphanica]|nr:hypothetical protein C8R42DRAFT_648972 [Lentinula raphanica]
MSLIPEFQAHPKKRNEAFDDIYSSKLVNNSLFATPVSLTAEEWKKSLLKWFDNNANKKKTFGASGTKTATKSDNTEFPMTNTGIETVAASSNTNPDTHDGFSWAKLRDQAKFFTDLTSAGIEVRSGRGAFAASKNANEDVVAAEWKSLSVDERNKWEKSAAASCDVPENRKRFITGLQTLLKGCLQFGHLGEGEIALVVAFDEGLKDGQRQVKSQGIFTSSNRQSSSRIQDVITDYDNVCRDLMLHLNETLKVNAIKDLKLKTEVPVDANGKARFPNIVDFDDASRSQLIQVYKDFVTAIWFQAGYTGPVLFEEIAKSPSKYYDTNLLPLSMKLRSPSEHGGWIFDLVGYLMSEFSERGQPFVLRMALSESSSSSSGAPKLPAATVVEMNSTTSKITPPRSADCPRDPSTTSRKPPAAEETTTTPDSSSSSLGAPKLPAAMVEMNSTTSNIGTTPPRSADRRRDPSTTSRKLPAAEETTTTPDFPFSKILFNENGEADDDEADDEWMDPACEEEEMVVATPKAHMVSTNNEMSNETTAVGTNKTTVVAANKKKVVVTDKTTDETAVAATNETTVTAANETTAATDETTVVATDETTVAVTDKRMVVATGEVAVIENDNTVVQEGSGSSSKLRKPTNTKRRPKPILQPPPIHLSPVKTRRQRQEQAPAAIQGVKRKRGEKEAQTTVKKRRTKGYAYSDEEGF